MTQRAKVRPVILKFAEILEKYGDSPRILGEDQFIEAISKGNWKNDPNYCPQLRHRLSTYLSQKLFFLLNIEVL